MVLHQFKCIECSSSFSWYVNLAIERVSWIISLHQFSVPALLLAMNIISVPLVCFRQRFSASYFYVMNVKWKAKWWRTRVKPCFTFYPLSTALCLLDPESGDVRLVAGVGTLVASVRVILIFFFFTLLFHETKSTEFPACGEFAKQHKENVWARKP